MSESEWTGFRLASLNTFSRFRGIETVPSCIVSGSGVYIIAWSVRVQ